MAPFGGVYDSLPQNNIPLCCRYLSSLWSWCAVLETSPDSDYQRQLRGDTNIYIYTLILCIYTYVNCTYIYFVIDEKTTCLKKKPSKFSSLADQIAAASLRGFLGRKEELPCHANRKCGQHVFVFQGPPDSQRGWDHPQTKGFIKQALMCQFDTAKTHCPYHFDIQTTSRLVTLDLRKKGFAPYGQVWWPMWHVT